MVHFLRKLIYSRNLNLIVRNILWPIKKILPNKFKIPVNGIVNVVLGNNILKFTANETSPMLKELFWNYNNCNFEFSNILIDLVRNSNTFFDIGSNIGYYSIIAKKANPNLNIFAFEPSNGPYHYLKENINLNKMHDIHAIKMAVGNENIVLDFYEDINPKFKYLKYHVSGTGNTQNTWNNQQTNRYSIECVTVDNFVEEYKISSVDVMKIDTEATEDKVLLGALNTIIKFQPIIICEVLPNKIEEQIFKIINNLEYSIFKHIEETDTLKLVHNFTADDNRNYIFAPKSKFELINKFIE